MTLTTENILHALNKLIPKYFARVFETTIYEFVLICPHIFTMSTWMLINKLKSFIQYTGVR